MTEFEKLVLRLLIRILRKASHAVGYNTFDVELEQEVERALK
jgi:hypothetical protein